MLKNAAPLKFAEADYLRFDPCEGDCDVHITCRNVGLRKARKQYACFMGADPRHGDQHTIEPGERYRYETALIDGDHWGTYRVCMSCMDKWLSEVIGDPEDKEAAAC